MDSSYFCHKEVNQRLEFQMQVEIPIELYNFFAEQAESQNCRIDKIGRETIKKFLERSN